MGGLTTARLGVQVGGPFEHFQQSTHAHSITCLLLTRVSLGLQVSNSTIVSEVFAPTMQ